MLTRTEKLSKNMECSKLISYCFEYYNRFEHSFHFPLLNDTLIPNDLSQYKACYNDFSKEINPIVQTWIDENGLNKGQLYNLVHLLNMELSHMYTRYTNGLFTFNNECEYEIHLSTEVNELLDELNSILNSYVIVDDEDLTLSVKELKIKSDFNSFEVDKVKINELCGKLGKLMEPIYKMVGEIKLTPLVVISSMHNILENQKVI